MNKEKLEFKIENSVWKIANEIEIENIDEVEKNAVDILKYCGAIRNIKKELY